MKSRRENKARNENLHGRGSYQRRPVVRGRRLTVRAQQRRCQPPAQLRQSVTGGQGHGGQEAGAFGVVPVHGLPVSDERERGWRGYVVGEWSQAGLQVVAVIIG